MKYLCLVYVDEKAMEEMPRRDYDALTQESMAHDQALQRSGHLLAAEALFPVHTATTVRVRNNKVSTTDGPFAETKEQLGGFVLIEAKDLNEAIQVASNIPMAKVASIEVRPVMGLEGHTQDDILRK